MVNKLPRDILLDPDENWSPKLIQVIQNYIKDLSSERYFEIRFLKKRTLLK